MSDTPTPPAYWDAVEAYLRLFFPQFFDENGPHYVDPDTMTALAIVSEEARPWCLREGLANLAQSMFIAYLVSLRNETMSGTSQVTTAGPVISEKEGDISTTYADLTKTGQTGTLSKRPPSDPWDAWNRLYMRCATGSILTRFGDPVKTGQVVTLGINPLVAGIFAGTWWPWQR